MPCTSEVDTLSDTSPDESPTKPDDNHTSVPLAILKTLRDHPAAIALYLLLLALIVSVAARFTLPNEFWLALTGILTGLGQQMASNKPDKDDTDQ